MPASADFLPATDDPVSGDNPELAARTASIDPLADLRARFVARSCDRLGELAAIVAEPAVDATALERLVRLAHQLAGSAGTFGCCELGRAAARLEEMALSHLLPGKAVDSGVTARLARRLSVVESELEALQPGPATATAG